MNRFGQVIGINSAKLNSSMFEGIGFAIPSADAQPVVEDLIAYGYVKDRVALGVMVIALSPVTGPANDLPSQGLYISSVEDYSDLNNHDITVGDVILTADGVTLETTSDLLDVLETHKPADTILNNSSPVNMSALCLLQMSLIPPDSYILWPKSEDIP